EHLDKRDRKQNSHGEEQYAGQPGQHDKQRGEPQRNPTMRCGKFSRAAFAADFGVPRIRMAARTEFEIVSSAAEITIERLSRCNSMALVAKAHRFLQERVALIARWPEPDGRPESI